MTRNEATPAKGNAPRYMGCARLAPGTACSENSYVTEFLDAIAPKFTEKDGQVHGPFRASSAKLIARGVMAWSGEWAENEERSLYDTEVWLTDTRLVFRGEDAYNRGQYMGGQAHYTWMRSVGHQPRRGILRAGVVHFDTNDREINRAWVGESPDEKSMGFVFTKAVDTSWFAKTLVQKVAASALADAMLPKEVRPEFETLSKVGPPPKQHGDTASAVWSFTASIMLDEVPQVRKTPYASVLMPAWRTYPDLTCEWETREVRSGHSTTWL